MYKTYYWFLITEQGKKEEMVKELNELLATGQWILTDVDSETTTIECCKYRPGCCKYCERRCR